MTTFERFLLKQFFNKSSRLRVLSERRRTEHGEMLRISSAMMAS